MSVPPQWLSFHEGVPTEWTPTSLNEAWATYGEVGAAFARYQVQAGWYLLEGPSGRAGHAWNASGPDTFAYRATGPFAMEIVDNKALSSDDAVRDASALTRNLLNNMRVRSERFADRRFDDVPRIGEIRDTLRATVRALETGSRQLPEGVTLVVTNYAGASEAVTRRLHGQGVRFVNVMPPGMEHAVRNRIPPELFEVRPGSVPVAPAGTRFSPAMRAAAVVSLALMAAGPVLARIRDFAERGRAEEKLRSLEPRIREHVEANPEDGVLLVFVYSQLTNIPPESLIGAVPVFHTVWPYYGHTRAEAIPAARIMESPPQGKEFVYREVWIPPPATATEPLGFSNTERGLRPEERGTLPNERGLSSPPPPTPRQ